MDVLRAAIARDLERGATLAAWRRAAASAWSRISAARVCRPLALPAGVPIVGVGGAVLGGAGKTPVAIAIARELARRGARPAVVGHAFRAAPGRARVVAVDDPVACVGDDALSAARLLADDGVPVVVAPTRQRAVELAASLATVLVVDGLLQATRARISDAVLVLDAAAPWGAGACPPLGDLRAPRGPLLAAADHVCLLCEPESERPFTTDGATVRIEARLAGTRDATGVLSPLAALAGARLGLALAVARPERIERALARVGLVPAVRVLLADHAPFDTKRLAAAHVDAWLTTARCATKLPVRIGGAPVLALDHHVDAVPLVDRLRFAAR